MSPRYRCRNCGRGYYSASALSFRCAVCGSRRFEVFDSGTSGAEASPDEVQPIAMGDHGLLLYDSEDLFVEYAQHFIADGLSRGDRVQFVLTDELVDVLIESIGPSERAAITVTPATECYGDVFDPDFALSNYERQVGADERPVRFFATTDFDESQVTPEEVLAYEARAHRLLINDTTCAICAYDTRRSSDYMIRAARRVHPVRCSGHGGAFVPNMAFDPTLVA